MANLNVLGKKINKGYKKQLQKIQTVIDCNKI